jgi:F-type H+-transporting ATPase subunit epsilon
MDKNKALLQLKVVTADRELLVAAVDSLTVTTNSGEITVLPGHVPLLSKLDTGELIYRQGKDEYSLVVSQGFINVAPQNAVTIMVDAGIHARDISEEKAQQAIKQAHETIATTQDRRELLLAEASLKRAMLELRVAQKTKRSQI